MTLVGQQILDTSDMAVPPLLRGSIGDTFLDPSARARSHRRGQFHAGTDFTAPEGTTLYAPRDAYVVCAVPNAEAVDGKGFWGYGETVGLWHYEDIADDGSKSVYTMYAHLQQTLVTLGQKIHAGTPIALTDASTGNPPRYPAMGAHAHLELRTMEGHPTPRPRPENPRMWQNTPFPVRHYGEHSEDVEGYLARFGIHYSHGGGARSPVTIDPGSPAERGLRMLQGGGPPPVSARIDSLSMQSPLPQRRGTPDQKRAGTLPIGPIIALGAFVGLVAFTIASPSKR